jgi:hypothetical protein
VSWRGSMRALPPAPAERWARQQGPWARGKGKNPPLWVTRGTRLPRRAQARSHARSNRRAHRRRRRRRPRLRRCASRTRTRRAGAAFRRRKLVHRQRRHLLGLHFLAAAARIRSNHATWRNKRSVNQSEASAGCTGCSRRPIQVLNDKIAGAPSPRSSPPARPPAPLSHKTHVWCAAPYA